MGISFRGKGYCIVGWGGGRDALWLSLSGLPLLHSTGTQRRYPLSDESWRSTGRGEAVWVQHWPLLPSAADASTSPVISPAASTFLSVRWDRHKVDTRVA